MASVETVEENPVDESVQTNHHHPVPPTKPDRPYFDAWLRRTRKQFAVSGRLSQVAALLSLESGENAQVWGKRLRDLLEDGESPSMDFLTHIDLILAKPAEKPVIGAFQGTLF